MDTTERIGYQSEEARILGDHVIDAALCGYEYSGLPKLLNVADHPRFKAPRRPMRVLSETSVSVLFDGGNQSGMLAMYYATRAVARAGPIGIHTVAAPPLVAPPGGARAALGTNPIAFGFPMEGDPLVIDLGTSAWRAPAVRRAPGGTRWRSRCMHSAWPPSTSSSRSSPICSFHWKTIRARWPPRSPLSRRRRFRPASTRSAFPANAPIA